MSEMLRRIAGLRAIVCFAILWGVSHSLIRLFAGTRLALDDGKENIFTQSFQWGYLPDNPPLFEWTLSALQQVSGPNLFSFLILKYTLFMGICVFAYLAAERLLKSKVWAFLSAISLIMLFQIGWNYDQVFTHSLMVTAFSAAFIWAFVRLVQDRSFNAYLIFALVAGLGSLSKYNFSGLVLAVIVSALLSRTTRSIIFDWRTLFTPLAIVACLAGPLLYLQGHAELYQMYLSGKLGLTEAPHIERVGEGLLSLIVAFISFYLPLLLFLAVILPRVFSRKLVPSETSDRETLACLGRTALIVMASMAIGVIVFGISAISERYMIPLLLPSFFWLCGRMKAASGLKDKTGLWIFAVASVFVVILGLRFTELAVADDPFCDRCRRWEPFEKINAAVAETIGNQDAILIAYESDTAGNLRAAFPDLTVRSLLLPYYRPPLKTENPPCYFIWSEEVAGAPVIGAFKPLTEAQGTKIYTFDWEHPFKSSWHQTSWGVSPVRQDTPFYRDYCTSE